MIQFDWKTTQKKNDEMLRPLGPKNKNDCHRGRNEIIAGKFHVLFFWSRAQQSVHDCITDNNNENCKMHFMQ